MCEDLPKSFSTMCDIRSQSNLSTSAELLRHLKFSAITNKDIIFKDSFGTPKGYMIWANVNKESLLKLKNSSFYPLYFYEWQEGPIVLILDIMILGGMTRKMRSRLIQFLSEKRIFAFNKNNKTSTYINWKNKIRRIS